MLRSLPPLTLFALIVGLSPLSAGGAKPGDKKPDDGKYTITQKITLQAMWVYEIEVTTKGSVLQMILVSPPKIEKKGDAIYKSQRPFLAKTSFEAGLGKDGKPEVKSSTARIRQFVDVGQGGEWELSLTFDRAKFSGEYSLNVKAVVTR